MTTLPDLDRLLAAVTHARVAVLGDYCLDAYWLIDRTAESSIETGLPVRKVSRQRYSLGGAGNVVANLAAIGVGHIATVGVVGDDLFGAKIRQLLDGLKVDADGLIANRDWQTLVYGKPVVNGHEESRIDFGAFNQFSPALVDQLLAKLDRAAGQSDVVIINQQVTTYTRETIGRINAVVRKHPRVRFIVDARQDADLYEQCLLKVNLGEAVRIVSASDNSENLARRIHARTSKAVFLTRGEAGIIVADMSEVHDVPGVNVAGQTDPVGAGDTVVAAVAAALAAGEPPAAAASFANLCASITVQKLHTTGTATPAEIRLAAATAQYLYNVELADDPRRARHAEGAEFEIIRDLPGNLAIRHAIFDHDGTLSTLREGWETIMLPMMVPAILGRQFDTAPKQLLDHVTDTVRQFIDQTTGIQTLVQMQGLAKLVREFGYVPYNELLDEHGYKQLYNRELLQMVGGRLKKLERGELQPEDFMIKNALPLLKHLHKRGVKLYLASGTDEADVIAEAKAMGYAELFEGRIFGAVGDVNVEAKKVVLERIIRENKLAGHQFVTFGDGPVEMRETRHRGGVAIGVCSDEVRRFGWNLAKRKRLIRGGADMLVPDFSQLPLLMKMLHLE